MRLKFALVVALLLSLLTLPASQTAATTTGSAAPVLAYYYIWWDGAAWTRVTDDSPQIGPYSSDDAVVVRTQIQQAKAAGIDGFLVSWKNTPQQDRRLRQLATIAGKEHFNLSLNYEALDFNRDPLPVNQVKADLLYFLNTFAADKVFLRVKGKPLAVLSGSTQFSHDEVAAITGPVRGSMLVLSSGKNVADYQRLADVTDGDAYYWSSVNPAEQPGYLAKLQAMGAAVHADGKVWIPPFAPGFDARQVGGGSAVARSNGQTLRSEYAAAQSSSPDLLGLISWNEFSENTHVEPSTKYGRQYVNVLHRLLTSPVAPVDPPSDQYVDMADSSASGGSTADLIKNLSLLGAMGVLFAVPLGFILVRRRRQRRLL